MDCLDFLNRAAKVGRKSVFAVTGEEPFLRDQALAAIRRLALGESDEEMGVTLLDGAVATQADVVDELATLPLLAPHRLVQVDPADPFLAVKECRDAVDSYLDHPNPSATLVLVTKKWNRSHRLAKRVEKLGCRIECRPVRERDMPRWLVQQAKAAYGKKLLAGASRLLGDLVGADMSRGDSELGKLAAYVGDRGQIADADVEAVGVGSRMRTIWQLMDSVADGRMGDALAVLDRLLTTGSNPVAVLAGLAWQVRRMVRAACLLEAGRSRSQICGEVGVPPYVADTFLRRVQGYGRERLRAGYRRLLDADLAAKGVGDLPARAVVERWMIQMTP